MGPPGNRKATDEQAAAAHAGPAGAYLIAAGPGTGKTFTMVERFCWLVEKGVPAESVLAVTFTERAAAELRERISRELAERGRRAQSALIDEAWIGTFHGVCTRLLRDNAYLLGGARFFHLSSANLHGRDQNPSQDGVQYFVGVMFTF